jgi:hypothetical protein
MPSKQFRFWDEDINRKVYGDHGSRIDGVERRKPGEPIFVGTYDATPDPGTTPDSVPFQNNWLSGDVSGNAAPASFYRDSDGKVHLQGAIAGGSVSTTIFTLPDGFRPSNRRRFIIASDGSAHILDGVYFDTFPEDLG